MSTPAGPPTPFAEGVWVDTAPMLIVGMPLTSTMTVIRLGDGGLLLCSPVELTPERRAAIEALGPVTHLYAPNAFHHLHIGEWAAAFPSARLHAPKGLAKKRPELRIDRVHGSAPEPAFADVVEELPIAGFRLEETVLFVRPTSTLVVADLVHNIGSPPHPWTKVYAGAMGFYDRIALSRMLRWMAFSDRAAARQSIDSLLELPFERVILGHGTPITTDAREALATAYQWLSATEPGPTEPPASPA